ncbi:MAG: hypothetical protein E7160_02345 [Firmicutes bacterium]|nr:hypothetical protein [Bacillota bacterium]
MKVKLPRKWQEKYNLAKAYYNRYGNLEISQTFKTTNGVIYDKNGIDIGHWISDQRQTYKGKTTSKLTEQEIKLLEDIKMKWFVKNSYDLKSQYEEINESNKKRKQIEILNRVRSYLNTYNEETLPTKEEINKGMVKVLSYKNNK